ncbi:MAG: hypothetical protein SF069_07360 [Phycisphaerae bacterium]|nr:hypothetical protein [Phycisphaerae bacterium]
MTTKKQKPAHTIKLGRVKAAIWANQSEKGGTRYNVTLTRLYKEGDTWKDSSSFGRDELPLAIKVLDLAHTWMFEQSQAEPAKEEQAAA